MSPEAAAEEKVDRESRIVDAVLSLLSRHGISGVSMRSVARDAGVALGLVNYYYADKAGLIKAALRRVEDQDVALVAPDPTAPPDERLRAALRRVADPEFLTTEYLALRLQLWALAHAHEYRSAFAAQYASTSKSASGEFRREVVRRSGTASRPHAPREHLRLLRHSAARRRGRRLDQVWRF